MNRLVEFNEDLHVAVATLKKGGLILYPTDTIWGIGCDATNPHAVSRIFSLKKREDQKAMLVLVSRENMIEYYVKEVPSVAWEILEVSDKPITIIYPGGRNLASNLCANDGSVGIRLTREVFTNALINAFGKAIVSTSANISGDPSPANFSEIKPGVINSVDYVVKYRQNDFSAARPSSIISLGTGGQIKIIRP